MLIKGTKYKGEIQKNTLYTICESKSLQFVEKQECGDEDDVNVSYTLYEGQYGAFAYEYRPPMVTKEIKKTDIFVLAVDEAEKRVASWVIDVKVSVGGEDVIKHLIDQWKDSHNHKKSILVYFSDFEERETIGVVTRDYQVKRIRDYVEKLACQISELTEELKKMPMTLVKISREKALLTLKLNYKVFSEFYQGKVEIDGEEHQFTVYYLQGNCSPYSCNINVSCS